MLLVNLLQGLLGNFWISFSNLLWSKVWQKLCWRLMHTYYLFCFSWLSIFKTWTNNEQTANYSFSCCHHDLTKVRLSYDPSCAIFTFQSFQFYSHFQYSILDHNLDVLYCCQPIEKWAAEKCIGQNQETVSRAINW